MGTIEHRGKKRKQRRDLKKAFLSAIQAAALVGVAIAAPKMPSALYRLGIVPNRQDVGTVASMRKRMIARGLVTINSSGFLRLTSKGKRELELMEARAALMQKKKKRWDGRWRVLVFDIPEYRKSVRNKMRRTLLGVGFMRLQDSVWIYPYDCEDFIVLLKADFKIGKDVLYIIVDELEGDSRIKRYFGLN